MNLVAIETSTEACSVAVLSGERVLERHALAPRRHAERVLPWIDALLAEAGLARSAIDAIAVGRGPGAFTGVRLGIAVAQGIGYALDRPLLPISTLAVLAAAVDAVPGTPVLAAIDARMGEVYACPFRADAHGTPQPVADERLLAPDAIVLPEPAYGWVGTGTGFAAVDGRLRERLGRAFTAIDAEALPRAAVLARLGAAAHARGEAIGAERIEPAYLREKVAQTLVERGVRPPRLDA